MKTRLGICLAAGLASAPAAQGRESYATCYDLRGQTASGTQVNKRTAAHNFLWPGTRIKITGRQPGPNGVRRYTVRDTGPALSDGHFDLWAPRGCLEFGKRSITYKLGWN